MPTMISDKNGFMTRRTYFDRNEIWSSVSAGSTPNSRWHNSENWEQTSQKLRNCPNFRYSKYSRIVKFGQDCEILAFSGNFSITYILYEFSMIICKINISLWRSSLNVFVIVFVFCICLRRCLFVGQVMFSHHSAQMSQSKIQWLSQSVSQSVSDKLTYRAVRGQLKSDLYSWKKNGGCKNIWIPWEWKITPKPLKHKVVKIGNFHAFCLPSLFSTTLVTWHKIKLMLNRPWLTFIWVSQFQGKFTEIAIQFSVLEPLRNHLRISMLTQ